VKIKNIRTSNNFKKKFFNNFLLKKISVNFTKIEKEILAEIENTSQTLNILNKNFNFNFNLKTLKRFKKFNSIAIIGMGGSILGAESLYQFLENKIKKKFYFFDDINAKKITLFKNKKNLKKTLFLVISKSGKTVETISNFLSLGILYKNSKNIIIISEKSNNPLYEISKRFNLFYIEHKKSVGGRYSVLSETGIVPAYLMGLNVVKLRSNILNYLKDKKKLLLKDNVIKLTHLFKEKKIKNIIFLNYVPELEKFLFWCQQLIAESLGKKKNGFLPVISSVPKDHHSLLQLYLDGPRDKLFYIFSSNNKKKKKTLTRKIFKKSFLNNLDLNNLKIAQKNALIETFKVTDIPYRELKINKFDEKTLGELFSYFILETIFIGKLSRINPFNQPAVEQVKVITKKLLS
tara:strand:+ start:1890 stop:3104 length:1215 start_codon:yes stop_codon:yes gene_type:complete